MDWTESHTDSDSSTGLDILRFERDPVMSEEVGDPSRGTALLEEVRHEFEGV